jgi:hypothetical protein
VARWARWGGVRRSQKVRRSSGSLIEKEEHDVRCAGAELREVAPGDGKRPSDALGRGSQVPEGHGRYGKA